jgi:hypothetical protein
MRFQQYDRSLIICDYEYYSKYQNEIDDWCRDTFKYFPRTGMVLTFVDLKDLTYFLLRWD